MAIYLIAYGMWRIIIEFFRTDARGAILLGLSPSQWQSFVFIAGGIALIVIYIVLKIPLILPKEKEDSK
jgi:prolipoprotein diacylglyceryltransferase